MNYASINPGSMHMLPSLHPPACTEALQLLLQGAPITGFDRAHTDRDRDFLFVKSIC